MLHGKKGIVVFASVALLGMNHRASAQFAVIDVAAVAQLIEELETLRAQLTQAEREFDSMTGDRGMEALLGNVARNYLPANWAQLEGALQGSSASYGALAAEVQAAVGANAVLDDVKVAALSPSELEQLQAQRRLAALSQAMTREALGNTSNRFDSLRGLITAIATAGDQKAALDLQARIQSEQGMLQNEQSKLQTLFQIVQAEESARKQRSREHAISDIGSMRGLAPMGLPGQ